MMNIIRIVTLLKGKFIAEVQKSPSSVTLYSSNRNLVRTIIEFSSSSSNDECVLKAFLGLLTDSFGFVV